MGGETLGAMELREEIEKDRRNRKTNKLKDEEGRMEMEKKGIIG